MVASAIARPKSLGSSFSNQDDYDTWVGEAALVRWGAGKEASPDRGGADARRFGIRTAKQDGPKFLEEHRDLGEQGQRRAQHQPHVVPTAKVQAPPEQAAHVVVALAQNAIEADAQKTRSIMPVSSRYDDMASTLMPPPARPLRKGRSPARW